MATDREELLTATYEACDPQQPLEDGDPRNLALDDLGHPRGPNWSHRVAREIEMSRQRPVLKLLTGLPGSGKSTEVRRLLALLSEKGYLTVLIDGEQELDLNSPLDTPELLAVVVHAVEQAVLHAEGNLQEKALKESFTTRLIAFFKGTEVNLEKLSTTKGPFSLTAALKTNPTLRKQFRTILEARRTEFLAAVRNYAGELNDRARATTRYRKGTNDIEKRRGVVVVFDSLEKLRGSVQQWEAIIDSAENVFRLGQEDLQSLPFHAVYTVPAALINRQEGIDFIHAVKIAERDGTPYAPGVDALLQLVRQRMPEEALALLFGRAPDRTALLKRIVEDSGGYLRNIVATLREAVLAESHPITEAFLDHAFQKRVDSYKHLVTRNDHELLRDIQERNDLILPDRSPGTRQQVEHLLTNSVVLRYQNTNDWFALHPAVEALMQKRDLDPDGEL